MPAAIADPIVQRLNALAQESSDLADAARVYAVILPLLRDANLDVAPIDLTEATARAKLEQGLPLLHEVDLAVDAQGVRDLMIRLARALEEPPAPHTAPKARAHAPDAFALYESARSGDGEMLRAAAVRQIRLALEADRVDMSALLPRVTAGDRAFVAMLARESKLDEGLLWALAQNAIKPGLRAWQRELSTLAANGNWQRGYCFVCGAAATLGELQGNDQEKHLRCGTCGADWRFPRLQCLYCGNTDPKTLGYLYPEKLREQMRIDICDNCHGYLKVISAFSPTPVECLAVQDLATLHLDYIAQERGYARVAIT
jgi:FdhE protein